MRRKVEGDTYHQRNLDSLSEMQGRFSGLEKPVNIGETNRYPRVAETPLTAQQPDHGFIAERDSVEEATSDKFGVDLTRLPGTPAPESSPIPQATDEVAPTATSSSFDRRF
jgi:hypothetical protein